MEAVRKSIHLFDLDDTLIRTEARVLVRDAHGSLLRALAPAEFTVYRPGPGEAFDFREFSDLGILSRGIVVKYTKTIIDTILRYGTRSEFGILTARADKKLHAPFLIRLFRSLFGVRLSNELIFAVSDQRFSGYKDRGAAARGQEPPIPFSKLSVSQRKALVIAEDLVGRGFNDISFYDDSRENLESFKVMRQAFPHVVYKPHFIDPTWKARLGEFWESGSESKPLIKGANSVRIILEHHCAAGADPVILRGLAEGGPIRLDTVPVWVVCEEGKFYLRRSIVEADRDPRIPGIP
ncbi:MAG: hypothetical protein JWP91_228 [Fibrobacteres bacterium]|nr:hypothetical protein [Fibrobacterota bacterium]